MQTLGEGQRGYRRFSDIYTQSKREMEQEVDRGFVQCLKSIRICSLSLYSVLTVLGCVQQFIQ